MTEPKTVTLIAVPTQERDCRVQSAEDGPPTLNERIGGGLPDAVRTAARAGNAELRSIALVGPSPADDPQRWRDELEDTGAQAIRGAIGRTACAATVRREGLTGTTLVGRVAPCPNTIRRSVAKAIAPGERVVILPQPDGELGVVEAVMDGVRAAGGKALLVLNTTQACKPGALRLAQRAHAVQLTEGAARMLSKRDAVRVAYMITVLATRGIERLVVTHASGGATSFWEGKWASCQPLQIEATRPLVDQAAVFAGVLAQRLAGGDWIDAAMTIATQAAAAEAAGAKWTDAASLAEWADGAGPKAPTAEELASSTAEDAAAAAWAMPMVGVLAVVALMSVAFLAPTLVA